MKNLASSLNGHLKEKAEQASTQEQRSRERHKECWSKHTNSVIRLINSGGLMNSIGIIANNIVLYTSNLLRN